MMMMMMTMMMQWELKKILNPGKNLTHGLSYPEVLSLILTRINIYMGEGVIPS